MEHVGKVKLSETTKTQLRLAARAHVAHARWQPEDRNRRQKQLAKLKGKGTFDRKLRAAVSQLRELLNEAIERGWAEGLERSMDPLAHWDVGGILGSAIDPETARNVPNLITDLQKIADGLNRQSQKTLTSQKSEGGRPRIEWDVLFVYLARIYVRGGGKISYYVNEYDERISPFMMFVRELHDSLPSEARCQSTNPIRALGDRARKCELAPELLRVLAELTHGETSARTRRSR